MQITEPMTMATDYALAAVSATFSVLLFQNTGREQAVWFFAAALCATAVAALAGGTYHGFAPLLIGPTQTILWKATVYAIGIGSFFFLAAAIVASVRPPAREWLLAAAVLKLTVYLVWMTMHDDFRYVIYDYAPSMLAVLGLQAADWRWQPGAPWIVAGIVVSFAAAAVQQSGIRLHRHFNHNDLYHVIQMGAIWLLYKGGRLLADLE